MLRPFFALLIFANTALADETKISRLMPAPDFLFETDRMLFPTEIPPLGPPPLYDIRKFFSERNGILLAADDFALWCPATGRMFIRTSQDNLDLITTEVSPTKEDKKLLKAINAQLEKPKP